MTKLLFVCTGNICRSPTAEGVMRALAERAGLAPHLTVDSAGMQDYHTGEAPDPRSAAAALRRGFPLDGLRARQVRREDFAHFDLLLALDGGHLRQLQRLAPAESAHKNVLFLEYAGVAPACDVPDPYYGTARDFEHALDLIVEGCERLLEKITAAPGA